MEHLSTRSDELDVRLHCSCDLTFT
jgi:hypothetical protein